jgi:RNA polymerase sigma-70 factor, ECF subfamily
MSPPGRYVELACPAQGPKLTAQGPPRRYAVSDLNLLMPTSLSEPVDPPDLLLRGAAGDPSALTALYERFGAQVYAIAARLLADAADAEDIVQEVFIRLPEALRSFDGRGDFGAWLRRVTTRTALMALRARSRRRESFGEVLERVAGRHRVDAVIDKVTVDEALAALTPALRVVVVLKEIEGYSHDEIASLLGISRAASEVRLFRATRALRRLLRDDLP